MKDVAFALSFCHRQEAIEDESHFLAPRKNSGDIYIYIYIYIESFAFFSFSFSRRGAPKTPFGGAGRDDRPVKTDERTFRP